MDVLVAPPAAAAAPFQMNQLNDNFNSRNQQP